MVLVEDITTGADITHCSSVLQNSADIKLDLSKLICVASDETLTIVGEKKGAVVLLQRHMESLEIKNSPKIN